MGLLGKSVLVTLLALWCFTSLVFTEEVNHVSQAPAPSPHHHHHHHHPKPPAKPPVPPAKPPVHPVLPPLKPPVKPPVPPVLPPLKPPVLPKPPVPPVLPPLKPPVLPKPPVYPPVKPPVKPPVLPKPPVYPPVKPPVKPPVLPKPPAYPPVKPPVKPPVLPPAHPPVLPPVYPPKFNRSLVAVQGMVYCKICKYAGVDTLVGAIPVKDAVVRLVCKGKNKILKEATTDENGYFFLLAPKTVTNYGFRGCTVKLVKSPNPKCSKPSKLHGGDIGGVLTPVKNKAKRIIVVNNLKYGLFDVGPFAFDPSCPR